MRTSPAPVMEMPTSPVPTPLISRLRRMTTSEAPAAMLMAFVPDTSTPAMPEVPSRMIDFVIVTAPKPPGSSVSISPLAAVLEIAPAKVLHGAVRLHGLASSPTPDTHVRVAYACARGAKNTQTANTAKALRANLVSFISFLLTTPLLTTHLPETKIAQNGQIAPQEVRINVTD